MQLISQISILILGVPYVIHHDSPWQLAYEQDILEKRNDIVGHYRISK